MFVASWMGCQKKARNKRTMKTKQIIGTLNKLFREASTDQEHKADNIPEDQLRGWTDPANISMIIPKNKYFLDLFRGAFNVDEELFNKTKVPELDYTETGGLPNKCKYPTEYLLIALELLKHYNTATIKMKSDYPLLIETDDFIFILAPRVDNE